ncbi:MAG: peptide ABC transporter substrate-binding protein [Bordetella sp.]|nr:peptide ABC transporter substrate-binding protein [Bordetella sp.]
MHTRNHCRGLAAALAAALMGALSLGIASTAWAGATLHRGNGGEPRTLDPALTTTNIEDFILKDLFEGLTVHDAAGKIVPGAAARWTISPDGVRYTFALRPDAKWSDGSPVTADDFVYSLRRLEDPKLASGYASIMYPVKNAEKVNTGALPLDQLGVKALDAKTLEITLERPTPFFLEVLAHQTALPVKRANVEKYHAGFVKPGVLVSNGAFRLTAHTPNDSLVIEKNANYWDAAHVRLDKVVYYPLDDQAAALRRFEAGEMDVVYNFSADQIKRLRAQYGTGVHVAPLLANYYYTFDVRHPPFDDVRVRRALSMAIDRDFLAQEIYAGAQIAAYSFVPPGIPSYGAPTQADFAAISQLEREDQAQALMREAGYGPKGKPLDIELRYNTSRNHERVATAIADMWKRVFGAKVRLLNLDKSSHYAYLTEGGRFDVARSGWFADYADAETYLALLTSSNKTFNYGRFDNAEFDTLMKQSYEERDAAARARVLHAAEAVLMKEQAVAPLLFQNQLWLISKRVQGWQDNASNQHLSRFLSVSE